MRIEQAPEAVPESRDPNDQMFLELALVANADVLVTGDDDLLATSGLEVAIITPAGFRERV